MRIWHLMLQYQLVEIFNSFLTDVATNVILVLLDTIISNFQVYQDFLIKNVCQKIFFFDVILKQKIFDLYGPIFFGGENAVVIIIFFNSAIELSW